MRASAAILALLLVAGSAFAQDSRRKPKPDYSRDTLLRLTAGIAEDDDDDDDRNLRFRYGVVDFRALGTNFQFFRLMLPLSGTTFGTIMNQPPDPFALTGTAIATGPRAWRTQREVNAELRRINETEKAKNKVRVMVREE